MIKRNILTALATRKGMTFGSIVLALCMCGTTAGASGLENMWKQFSAAQKRDATKDAIAILQRIEKDAMKQKSYGDLLYAMIREHNCQAELSPDSAEAAKNRLMERQKQWRSTNGVLAAICQTVLQDELGTPSLDSLLASKDAAAYTRANGIAAYRPLIKDGADGLLLDNTLASVIALHTGQYKELYRYYASTDNRKAACVAAALWAEREDSITLTDSLIQRYQDLPECGALAVVRLRNMSVKKAEEKIAWIDEALTRWPKWRGNNELRNERAELTNPQFHATVDKDVVTSDTNVMLHLQKVRNVKGVKVTLLRVNKREKPGYDMERKFSKAFTMPNDYDETADSISIGRLPCGRWTVTVADSEGRMTPQKMELCVTDLKIIHLPLPKKQLRLVVVNAVTGQPVPGATIRFRSGNAKAYTTLGNTNSEGEYIWKRDGRYGSIVATKGADGAMKPVWINNYFSYSKEKNTRKRTGIYTDRSIYRPGQTVKAALVRYQVVPSQEVSVINGDTITVKLRNNRYEEVEQKKVVTDAYGAASVEFRLPEDGRNGTWHLVTDNGSSEILVEEYKRPTFDVTLEQPSTAYHSGDTVTVKGTARMYSGAPVANARVAYKVRRNSQWWWRHSEDAEAELLNDTVITAADGTFYVRMPMVMPKDNATFWPRFYSVSLTANVTDNAGESHNAVMSLPLSNREAYLSCTMPGEILADSAITVNVSRRNAAGTAIDGTIKMVLDGKELTPAEANKPYTLARTIPSGEHMLMAICEGDTVRNTFVAFRKNDARPMKYTHQWCYQSATSFPNDGSGVWVQVGTSDNDVRMFYTVFAGDSIIAQGSKRLDNENITRTLYYKKAYGDGLTAALAWVKDGVMYSRVMKIARPLPEKKLKMQWTTFRDRLTPGQKERWTVSITNPDGTPAKARMMAVLYDKSLEQLSTHSWSISDMRYLSLPYAQWRTSQGTPMSLWLAQSRRNLNVSSMAFPYFAGDATLSYYGGRVFITRDCEIESEATAGARMRRSTYAMDECLVTVPQSNRMMAKQRSLGAMPIVAEESTEALPCEDDVAAEQAQITPRSDFAETAFFMPAVMTDAKGQATVAFTLPESVTTWRFMAMAHDKDMRNATLVADAVAQKQLMIQPNMPRFLRQGDEATVASTVSNLSDKEQTVQAIMTILDAKTEQTVQAMTLKTTVKAGETAALTFPVDGKKMAEGEYIFRFTAQGDGHTDGEQRSIVVLSDEEMITATAAYSFLEPTDTVLTFSDMIPQKTEKAHLKVDYVDNPAWLMMEAIPGIAEPKSQNAMSLSAALYANRVGASMKWTESKSANILMALQQLQNADGSFSWWKGMEGSMYMTTAVVKTLARLNKLCGRQDDTQQLMNKAFRYLQREVDEDVARMKKWEKNGTPYVSDTHLDWLYALTLEGRKGGASAAWLLSRLAKSTNKSDMATKAVAALVLNANGQKGNARTFVEAIKQHTVYRKDVGRYFDSYRAAYSWCDYRIPTQTLAIEAISEVTPKDRQTVSEMRRWLLSSKRTQDWGNAVNAVNAIHAFFGGSVAVLTYEKGKKTLADTEVTPRTATVEVHKQSDCESWAAAYVTFKQKSADVKTTATGLAVKREVLVNGKTATNGNVRVGDRVTVRITVTADRDYDFVTVTDNRAACLEPVSALSGYNGRCYQEVKDRLTAFHYNKMSKGTHVIETEYYADREGEYLAGTVTAECAYANEFRGTEGAYRVQIKK